MTKKTVVTIAVLFFGVCALFIVRTHVLVENTQQPDRSQNVPTVLVSPTPQKIQQLQQSIFIPYWALGQDKKMKEYDEYYYFGVAPAVDGTIKNEQGKKNIELLDNLLLEKTTLVVRMMDADVNKSLMEHSIHQKKLGEELQKMVNEKGFKGVAFDIEIPFSLDTVKSTQITQFVQEMCSSIQADYKTCELITYGDIFYRKRPFDMKAIDAVVDRVVIMAYDFHKAGGEQGPNFSFSEKEKYGYDFKTMVQDFASIVPKDKIGVVFGMYGYDWTLNEQGTPLKSATALSLNEIRTRLTHNANRQNDENVLHYTLHENEDSEKSIQYVDEEGEKHVVWYEDEESASVKAEYLKNQGISHISFWALGYF